MFSLFDEPRCLQPATARRAAASRALERNALQSPRHSMKKAGFGTSTRARAHLFLIPFCSKRSRKSLEQSKQNRKRKMWKNEVFIVDIVSFLLFALCIQRTLHSIAFYAAIAKWQRTKANADKAAGQRRRCLRRSDSAEGARSSCARRERSDRRLGKPHEVASRFVNEFLAPNSGISTSCTPFSTEHEPFVPQFNCT